MWAVEEDFSGDAEVVSLPYWKKGVTGTEIL